MSHRNRARLAPEVYVVLPPDLVKAVAHALGQKGVRGWAFDGDDPDRFIEVFRTARPRPAVLVTCGLDSNFSGLQLIRRCREIEPRLQVLLWNEYPSRDLATAMSQNQVKIDAIARCPAELTELPGIIEWLIREAGLHPENGPVRPDTRGAAGVPIDPFAPACPMPPDSVVVTPTDPPTWRATSSVPEWPAGATEKTAQPPKFRVLDDHEQLPPGSMSSIRISGEPLVFVLDEDYVARFYALGLNEAGCRVKTFNKDSIHQLIEEFRAAQPRPDLLITGCLNSSGAGLAAAAACQAINPNLKVFLVTGFPEKARRGMIAVHSVTVDAIYAKPFPISSFPAFMATVAELLAAPRSVSATH